MDYSDSSSSFETSEMVARLLGSTPLLEESWRLCSLANTKAPRSFLTERIGDVGYVAFSGVQVVVGGSDTSMEAVVALDPEGGRWKDLFRALIYPCEGEKPVMLHKGFLQLFLDAHSSPFFKGQIDDALGNCKSIVVTGHSIGGTIASFTALWLLSRLLSIKSTISILCITFGSPLIGNDSLNRAILRERWGGSFIHIAAKHDIMPRLLLLPSAFISDPLNSLEELWQCYMDSPSRSVLPNDEGIARFFESVYTLTRQTGEQGTFWPFGSYLLCSNDGAICMDDATSIVKLMDLMQIASSPSFGMEDHLKYWDYVGKISSQFFQIETFRESDHLAESSYETGISLALHSSGINRQDVIWTDAKECLELSRRLGRAPNLNAASLALKLSKITPCRAQIEWYKVRCDRSPEAMGYYDTFRRGGSSKREHHVNMNRIKLGRFWDDFINMVERNELPHDLHRRSKWVNASQFYKLLFEPLEIAAYYRLGKHREKGHYRSHGRERRFEIFDRWWQQRRVIDEVHKNRSKYASLTQDSCFWARVEEAKDWLDDAKNVSVSDMNKLALLMEKLSEFERYADELIENKDVSEDVLAKNSSYSLWVREWRAFNLQPKQLSID